MTITRGRKLLADGMDLLETGIQITGAQGPTQEAARAIDDAVRLLRSAMNWLEDTY